MTLLLEAEEIVTNDTICGSDGCIGCAIDKKDACYSSAD